MKSYLLFFKNKEELQRFTIFRDAPISSMIAQLSMKIRKKILIQTSNK